MKDLDFVEKKGCITFSKICVNLGKVADLETGQEKYSCTHNFPEDCSEYKCPVYTVMADSKEWRLRKLSPKELKMLRDFKRETRQK